MPKPAYTSVADYLTAAIDASSKSQLEIAAEVGFPRSNIISMLKMGITKLPITRIPALAEALDRDPIELFRLAMEEYMPDMLEICDELYKRELTVIGESEVLKRIRVVTGGKGFRMSSDSKTALDNFVNTLK